MKRGGRELGPYIACSTVLPFRWTRITDRTWTGYAKDSRLDGAGLVSWHQKDPKVDGPVRAYYETDRVISGRDLHQLDNGPCREASGEIKRKGIDAPLGQRFETQVDRSHLQSDGEGRIIDRERWTREAGSPDGDKPAT